MNLQAVLEWIARYGYPALIPIAVLDGAVVATVAGLLCARGYYPVYAVFPILVAGELVGDCLLYGTGRWGDRSGWLARWGRAAGLTAPRLAWVRERFRANPGKTLVAGKVYHGVGMIIPMAAGAARLAPRVFFSVMLPATLGKVSVYFGAGWAAGRFSGDALKKAKDAEILLSVIAILVLTSFFVARRVRKSFFP